MSKLIKAWHWIERGQLETLHNVSIVEYDGGYRFKYQTIAQIPDNDREWDVSVIAQGDGFKDLGDCEQSCYNQTGFTRIELDTRNMHRTRK